MTVLRLLGWVWCAAGAVTVVWIVVCEGFRAARDLDERDEMARFEAEATQLDDDSWGPEAA